MKMVFDTKKFPIFVITSLEVAWRSSG